MSHTKLSEAKYHLDKASQVIQAQREEIEHLKAERQRLDVRMRVCDIAEFLGCSTTTVWRMLNDGRLKSKKMIDVLDRQKRR
ncbi:regulatory protein, crp family [Fodinibius roseus]|uniref:Regulatory protein, crp family n=1 Tax=Fodinibius roseus TaxID=1194090 RepID=A0A1M4UPQ6_9BACT|nr:hypothetical protein [Fodinibius roseus]SHE58731.1 regulatory protein, crp family [Fodinibius roseus]